MTVTAASGLRFEGTAFWVRHRHREYGPFDYEWSRDLGGVELIYGREKFGEFCSADEIYADLKEFHLPMAGTRGVMNRASVQPETAHSFKP